MHHCKFCGKALPSETGLKKHQAQATSCRLKLERHLQSYATKAYEEISGTPHNEIQDSAEDYPAFEDLSEVNINLRNYNGPVPATLPQPRIVTTNKPGQSHTPDQRATVEEVEDEGDELPGRFVASFPEEFRAGMPVSEIRYKTTFERMRDDREAMGGEEAHLYPFENTKQWELAEWLVKNVGQTKIDDFLKLAAVSTLNVVHKLRLGNTHLY